MPKPNQSKAENPRFEAMKAIHAKRLDDISTDDGRSLRQAMEDQGVEMADPDAPIVEDTKDSDTHDELAGQNKNITIDIESDVITPEEDGVKAEEPKAVPEPEAKAEPKVTPETDPEPVTVDGIPVYEKDGKYYTKIMVNGVEEEMDFNTLKASAQKDRASFDRFQAAAAKEHELAAREDALNRAAAAAAVHQNIPAQPQPAAPAPTAQDTSDTVDELYDSLAYADEDTVKAKLAEIVSGQAQPQSAAGREEVSTQNEPVDIQAEVEAAIDRKAMQDWEIQREAAVSQWNIDFEDIANDPELRGFANMESAKIAEANPTQALDITLRQAGEKTRAWRDFQQQGTVAGGANITDDTAQTRTARKQSAPAPVRANSAVASRTVADDKPPTRSEVVAGIRAGRGQAA